MGLRLARIRRLAFSELFLFFEALVWLSLAYVALALAPYRWVHRLVSLKQEFAEQAGDVWGEDSRLGRYALAIRRGVRHLPFSTKCLCHALAGKWMLGARGIRADLYIGVRAKGSFAAHAWLACGGRPLIGGGSQMEGFKRLDEM